MGWSPRHMRPLYSFRPSTLRTTLPALIICVTLGSIYIYEQGDSWKHIRHEIEQTSFNSRFHIVPERYAAAVTHEHEEVNHEGVDSSPSARRERRRRRRSKVAAAQAAEVLRESIVTPRHDAKDEVAGAVSNEDNDDGRAEADDSAQMEADENHDVIVPDHIAEMELEDGQPSDASEEGPQPDDEGGAGAPAAEVGEGDAQTEASAMIDMPFSFKQSAEIMKGISYHIDNHTWHKFYATAKTLTENHSGSSGTRAVRKTFSAAQRALLPESGEPPKLFGSCALVGNARSLLRKSYGKEIDRHDAVMRVNQGPTAGFERHVGSKTTFRLINHKWADAYTSVRSKLQLETDVTLVVSRTDWRSFLKIAHNMRQKRADVHTLLMSRGTVDKSGELLRALKARMEAVRGKAYPGKGSPSSGFVGTYHLLQHCDHVDIYGIGTKATKGNVPNWHYFENHRFHSSREFGRDPHHSFQCEHDVLRVFHAQGIVNHHTV